MNNKITGWSVGDLDARYDYIRKIISRGIATNNIKELYAELDTIIVERNRRLTAAPDVC